MLTDVLNRFGLRRTTKAAPSVPIINDGAGNRPTVRVRYVSTLGTAAWSSHDYESMAQAGYVNNSDVYACVSLIASAGKQVKWDSSPGSGSLASLKLLKEAGGPNYIEAWLSYLLLAGNAYTQIGRNAAGSINGLHSLSPAIVTAVPNRSALYQGEV